MDLQIKNQLFVVCGATSGLGKAVAEALMHEGASIIAVGRRQDKLHELQQQYPMQVDALSVDITQPESLDALLQKINGRIIHGVLVNAGGPPAKAALETQLPDWDEAYRTVLRWKVALVQALVPPMMGNRYGRIVFIESISVKQPVQNLVLSNAMRMAAVGFAKTLSTEVGSSGVTINVLAPGYHDTDAMKRLVARKKEQLHIDDEAARQIFASETSVGYLGDAKDFGSIACWLLSPHSRFITGQTISVDGGLMKGVMG